MPIAPYDYSKGGPASSAPATPSTATPVAPTSGGRIAPYDYATGGAASSNPEADKIAQYSADQTAAQTTATQANSPMGLFKNTISAMGSRIASIPGDFINGLATTYGNAATSIPKDVVDAGNSIANLLPSLKVSQTGPRPLTAEQMNARGMTPGQIATNLSNEPGNSAGVGVDKAIAQAGFRPAGDFAGAVFAPISSAIGAAVKAAGIQSLLDSGGNVIANGSGITDIPAFQQFALQHPNAAADFNRVLNLAMSGGDSSDIAATSKKVASDIVDNVNRVPITPDVTTNPIVKLPVTGDTTPRSLPVSGESTETPVSIQSQYTNPADLPTIQMGSTPKDTSGLPNIQMAAQSGKISPYTYEPVTNTVVSPETDVNPTAGSPVASDVANANPAVPDAASTVDSSAATAPDATTASRANDINTKLVAKGLDSLPENQLAKFNPITKADQIVKVSSLLDNDPERAVQAALGHADVPEGIHPQVLFNAVANAAEESGNTKLLADLAASPHATDLSESAQTMSASNFNRDTESTMSNLQRIRDIKSSAVDPKLAEKAQSASKSAGTKINLSKEDLSWDKFLNGIKC